MRYSSAEARQRALRIYLRQSQVVALAAAVAGVIAASIAISLLV
jgi:hypothetical protein